MPFFYLCREKRLHFIRLCAILNETRRINHKDVILPKLWLLRQSSKCMCRKVRTIIIQHGNRLHNAVLFVMHKLIALHKYSQCAAE